MNSSSGIAGPGEIRQQCAVCGEGTATWSMQEQAIPYGTGSGAVILVAEVPVWSCADCEVEYLANGAEALRHEAVCRHLGRLTPADIRRVRNQAGLTQAGFAEALNVGLASVKRWESGAVLPNASMNRLLKEFALRPRAAPRSTPRFRTELSVEKIAAANRWKLRPTTSLSLLAA